MEVTANGILDTQHAERRVWLVKVPDYLAERLQDMDEDNVDLGTVQIIPAGPNGPARVQVNLNPNGPCGDLPLEYTMPFTKCQQKMYIWAEDEAGRPVAMEGRVEQECQLKPLLNDQYRQVMQQRESLANRPKRTVRMIDGEEETSHRLGLIPHVNEYEMMMRRRKRYEPEQRKERLPREEVMESIFRAFERTPHWTLKGLLEVTQQPAVYLKEILAEVAVYIKRGPYKNLYELLPEYRTK